MWVGQATPGTGCGPMALRYVYRRIRVFPPFTENVSYDIAASGMPGPQLLTMIGMVAAMSWYGAVSHMQGELIWLLMDI